MESSLSRRAAGAGLAVMSWLCGAACTTNAKLGDLRCGVDADCPGGACVAGTCATCADLIKNGAETDVDCGGPDCDAAGKACAIGKACAVDLDCATGASCSSGTCVAQLPGGAPCVAAHQCATGSCVDGVCCDTACDAACHACAAALTGVGEGTCSAVPDGTVDPRHLCAAESPPGCGQTGSCRAGTCAYVASGTPCGAATCTGGQETLAGSCTGDGACAPGATTPCAPYACGPAACTTACAGPGDCAAGYSCDAFDHCASGPLQWRPVTVANLPAGASIVGLWTGSRGDVHVMASLVDPAPPNMPETWILHRTFDGVWSTLLHLSDSYGSSAGIWGTAPTDIFAAVTECPTGTSGGWSNCTAAVHHSSDGASFTQEALPAAVGASGLHQFGGELDDVYVAFGAGVLRHHAGHWSVVYDCLVDSCKNLAYLGPNEIFMTSCWGYWAWNGSSWIRHDNGFDFCDIYKMWGLRSGPQLSLYVTGSNNFSNGEKTWQFQQTGAVGVGSWGSKSGYVHQDCNIANCGGGAGLWGSAASDVWVAAGRNGDSCAGTGGHAYHYDGSSWAEDTGVGLDKLDPGGVWGTAWDDVWIWAYDSSPSSIKAPSQLFHYGYVP